MAHTVWAQGDIPLGRMELRSWGNGVSLELAYVDGHHGERSVFVQGDDAAEMKDQWDAMERIQPDKPTGELLALLWSVYS
jgi:hypothetical protein